MNIKILRDKRNRIQFKKKESLAIVLKLLFRITSLSLIEKLKFICLKSNSFYYTLLKNHCVLTGRSHSINRRFKLSRIKFKEFASVGLLLGVKKFTW